MRRVRRKAHQLAGRINARRPGVHQHRHDTLPDRYPEAFGALAEMAQDPAAVLSFGCSNGTELVSLKRYWPDAAIVGVEINPALRLVARARARTQVVAEIPDRRFDVVLAMAVLCRHPMTAHPTEWYPFSDFRDQVRRLVDAVEPGGLACFDNVSYRPTDADDRIEPVWSGGDAARIVPVHDPDGTSAEPVGPIFRRVR